MIPPQRWPNSSAAPLHDRFLNRPPMPKIQVNLPAQPYSITIERGVLERIGELISNTVPHKTAMLAVDANIAANHSRVVEQSLRRAGYRVVVHELIADETHKTLDAARVIYQRLLEANFERSSPFVAVGGGVVGDVAGFAAATFKRGMPLIQVPTTLLAMVDASIGGKTGVNMPLPGGELVKNVIGAFWQPVAVFIDPEVLQTLDARDFRCGLAECVKHALIADVDLLTFIADHAARLCRLDMDVLSELIERSARIKVAIVEADEREHGQRALLNLGHTFAHAIEPIPELDLKHGEAVAIGLAAAMHCSVQMGRMEPSEENLVVSLLELLDLPTRLSRSTDVACLLKMMAHDKKVSGGKLRLVLPVGLGNAEIFEDVPESIVLGAWEHVGA